MKQYYPRDVIRYFGISSEGARQWAKEFRRHLDVLGQPAKNRHRVYSLHDMQVFATIATLKDTNHTYREIHAALDNGTLYEFQPDDVDGTPLAAQAQQTEIAQLKIEINRLEIENNLLRGMIKEKEEELFEAKYRLMLLTEGKDD